MIEDSNLYIPSRKEFRKGYEAYNQREKRGFVYFEALETVEENWGSAGQMARGVQRLVRSWNRFYANFSFSDLTRFMGDNIGDLNTYRDKHIRDLNDADDDRIRQLFKKLLQALKREADGALSPVSVAKAFGVLGPNFLPIWDSHIAFRYDCLYFSDTADEPYLRFCHKMKALSERVQNYVPDPDDRSLLKRIDEYNYSKYTMFWI